ncbi:MAG: hypothetical protein GXP15_08085 [Gammaproteobacteria bacterium]|nr:hypothetical protein [Gammaproteobacteria bacterium]
MNTPIVKIVAFLLMVCAFLAGCGGSSTSENTLTPPPPPPVQTRSFYMGFTPWPWDATQTAVDDVNQRIQDNGDIVDHHIMVGVPWEAALQGLPYPAEVDADLNDRVQMLQPGKEVFLAIDSLNGVRDAMAANWGVNFNEPRPPPWDTRSFADVEVTTAYLNFALDLIARFDPVYFNYGTEISELMLNDPAAFDDYVVFAEVVYNGIKAQYPNLPVMISIAIKSPGSAEMATIATGFERILDYVDVVGVSVYPYIFYNHADKGDPDNMPDDWLSQVQSLAQGKPLAITETGWIAEDLIIPSFGVNVPSSEAFQQVYASRLLSEADALDAEFVIWWTVVDFDALWNGVLLQDPVASIWRDIGLYDENLRARPALDDWQSWLARSRN